MTFKTFTTILLATSILLFTACDSKVQTDTADEQNTTVQIDNAANTTEEGSIGTTSEENNVNTGTIRLNSLKLTINKTTLNKDENTTLKVMATYSDTSTKDVTEEVQWISSQNNAVKITNHALTALQDRQTTLQAKLNNVTSEAIVLNIYWEVNGHSLPPEPDPTVNNATLLGIDVNDNGVRDDVERKIYEQYPVKLHRELLLDGAKVFQKIAVKPVEEAQEIVIEVTKVLNCKTYLRRKDERIRSYSFELVKTLENLTYDTKERVRKYLDYNLALSGGVYGGGDYADINENACTPETINALMELGL